MRAHQKIFNEASRFAIVRLAQELLAVSVALAFALAPILASAEEEPEEPDHYLGDGHVDPEEDEAADLARAVQNPVADLISVPFQNNTNFDFGPRERTQNVLNIQPVIPFSLSDDWLMITRTIIPIVSQPSLFPGRTARTDSGTSCSPAFCRRRTRTCGSGARCSGVRAPQSFCPPPPTTRSAPDSSGWARPRYSSRCPENG